MPLACGLCVSAGWSRGAPTSQRTAGDNPPAPATPTAAADYLADAHAVAVLCPAACILVCSSPQAWFMCPKGLCILDSLYKTYSLVAQFLNPFFVSISLFRSVDDIIPVPDPTIPFFFQPIIYPSHPVFQTPLHNLCLLHYKAVFSHAPFRGLLELSTIQTLHQFYCPHS